MKWEWFIMVCQCKHTYSRAEVKLMSQILRANIFSNWYVFTNWLKCNYCIHNEVQCKSGLAGYSLHFAWISRYDSDPLIRYTVAGLLLFFFYCSRNSGEWRIDIIYPLYQLGCILSEFGNLESKFLKCYDLALRE